MRWKKILEDLGKASVIVSMAGRNFHPLNIGIEDSCFQKLFEGSLNEGSDLREVSLRVVEIPRLIWEDQDIIDQLYQVIEL